MAIATSSFHDMMVRLASGDPAWADIVIDRYTKTIVRHAALCIPIKLRPKVDPEDIAQSVFRIFVTKIRQGEYQNIDEWEAVRKLLLTITVRRAAKSSRYFRRLCRSVDQEVSVDNLNHPNQSIPLECQDDLAPLDQLITEEDAVIWHECLQSILESLTDRHRQVVQIYITNPEISRIQLAAQCGTSVRSVQRVIHEFHKKVKLLMIESFTESDF